MDVARFALRPNINKPYLYVDLKLAIGTVFSRFEGESECQTFLVQACIYILLNTKPGKYPLDSFIFILNPIIRYKYSCTVPLLCIQLFFF